MSISVHCEECGKTYQLRDEMAGRKGKCPKGHRIEVPVPYAAPAQAENEFAFTGDSGALELADPRPSKKVKKVASRTSEPAAEETVTDGNDFSFPRTGPAAARDEEPALSPSRYGNSKRAPKEKAGGGSMMPMLVGGVVAILGIGGGMALFFMARSEVSPLREQAEAANKKATDAELRAKTAEAVAAAAEAKLPELQKNLTAREAELKTVKEEASTAKRKAAKLEQAQRDAEAAKPVANGGNVAGAKKDAADAKGEMAAKMPDGAPTGGKNWTAPASITFGMLNHKAGDRLLLKLKEDKTLKAEAGALSIKFHFDVPKGKEMPAETFATLFIAQAGSVDGLSMPIKLTGASGDSEAVFQVKGYTGSANIMFFISDGNTMAGTRNMKVFSTFIATQADFDNAKE